MKIETSKLIGAALDWAVGEVEFRRLAAQGSHIKQWVREEHDKGERTDPWASDWVFAGPIIDLEGIALIRQTPDRWTAQYSNGCEREDHARSWGATPIVAAMRCYVLAKLGEYVEIPDCLN